MELLVTAAVVALNVAEVVVDATITEAGTVSAVLLLDRPIDAPPAGAAWDNVMVQMLEVFGPTVVGVQDNDARDAGATSVMVLLDEFPL